jgi:hypothetical protein
MFKTDDAFKDLHTVDLHRGWNELLAKNIILVFQFPPHGFIIQIKTQDTKDILVPQDLPYFLSRDTTVLTLVFVWYSDPIITVPTHQNF